MLWWKSHGELDNIDEVSRQTIAKRNRRRKFKKKEKEKINKYIECYKTEMQLVTSKINTLKNTYEKITSISIGKLNPSLSEKNVRNLNYKKLNTGKLCDKKR